MCTVICEVIIFFFYDSFKIFGGVEKTKKRLGIVLSVSARFFYSLNLFEKRDFFISCLEVISVVLS